MCKKGDTSRVYVFNLDKVVDVDRCLESLVKALNSGGIEIHTVASCCGHGKRPGYVRLADGRELIIAPDKDTAMDIMYVFDHEQPISIADIRECCPQRALAYCLTHESSTKAVIRCYKCHTTHFGPLHVDIIKPVWEHIQANLNAGGAHES